MSKKRRKRKALELKKYEEMKKKQECIRKKKECIKNKLNETSNNKLKEDLKKEEMTYCKIISKLTDKKEYLNLFYKYVFNKMSLLDFMDKTEDIIENSNITNEELNKLNSILKYKFLNERYTVDRIIREENTISDNIPNKTRKAEKTTGYNSLSNQNRRRKPTKSKKLAKRIWVRSIIYNAVGTKR